MSDFNLCGYEIACDLRMPEGYRRKVLIRETKMMWISKDGRRYSKKNDGRVYGSWPIVRLDTSSIEPASTEKA